ncbi:hypothetical protein HPB47_020944, partial [Ixodes persulcatus]
TWTYLREEKKNAAVPPAAVGKQKPASFPSKRTAVSPVRVACAASTNTQITSTELRRIPRPHQAKHGHGERSEAVPAVWIRDGKTLCAAVPVTLPSDGGLGASRQPGQSLFNGLHEGRAAMPPALLLRVPRFAASIGVQ